MKSRKITFSSEINSKTEWYKNDLFQFVLLRDCPDRELHRGEGPTNIIKLTNGQSQ